MWFCFFSLTGHLTLRRECEALFWKSRPHKRYRHHWFGIVWLTGFSYFQTFSCLKYWCSRQYNNTMDSHPLFSFLYCCPFLLTRRSLHPDCIKWAVSVGHFCIYLSVHSTLIVSVIKCKIWGIKTFHQCRDCMPRKVIRIVVWKPIIYKTHVRWSFNQKNSKYDWGPTLATTL